MYSIRAAPSFLVYPALDELSIFSPHDRLEPWPISVLLTTVTRWFLTAICLDVVDSVFPWWRSGEWMASIGKDFSPKTDEAG